MSKKMSGGKIALIVILAVIVIGTLWVIGSYNGLVKSDVGVSEKWGNIQADYQRRADLIPNLVAAVKSYTTYEGTVLTEVTEARAAWANANNVGAQMSAANQMDSALGRLIAVAENYPNLKANENYLSLQDELAGTENRIKFSRTEYNGAVKTFNVKVRTFPTNLIAGMFGFTQKTMFESQAGAETAPNVAELL